MKPVNLRKWREAQEEEKSWWTKILSQTPKSTLSAFYGNRWTSLLPYLDAQLCQNCPTVVDVGSGPHGLIYYLPLRGQKVAIDPLIDSYRLDLNTTDVFPVKGVGESIPIGKDQTDLCFLINALEHTVNPQQVLEEIWRILQPGGYLICQVYTQSVTDLAFIKLGYVPPLSAYHPHHILANNLISTLERIGFRIEKCEMPFDPVIIDIFNYFKKSGEDQGSLRGESVYNIRLGQRFTHTLIRLIDNLLFLFSKRRFAKNVILIARKQHA